MTGDNLIDLAAYREQVAQRDANRGKEADALLDEIRAKKRVSKDDRPTLVSNLGRLIHQMEPDDRMDLAARVLETKWPKRKRYIRFPDESPDLPARYAASGLDFARIIHQIVGEKARKGLDRTQATIETVYGVLKGTSFRRPSRFQISEGIEGG